MRRFNLQNRMRRCRNLYGAGESICVGAVGVQRERNPCPEVCEVTFEPGISARQRAYILDCDDLYCRMCGAAPGDIDDLTGGRVQFYIELIADKSIGGKDELSNLRTLCSTCNQGAKNITSIKPPAIWLLSQIRRAGQEEQRAVLDWLLTKFKE